MYPLVDRILDGRLDAILSDWKNAGLSPTEMAFRLRLEHDIKVSPSTVLRWLAESDQGAA